MPQSSPLVDAPRQRLSRGRRALARARYYRTILRAFRGSLAVIVLLNVAGAALIRGLYPEPIPIPQALHAAFAMMFMEFTLAYPDGVPVLQALWVAAPVLGLTIVAESLVRFAATIFSVENRKEDWVAALASTFKGHVVVCGLGRLGLRVVRQLRREGAEVVVIEKDPDDEYLAEIEALEIPVVIGDATRPPVLKKANVAAARAVLVLTDNDLANLDVGLAARELNPDVKTVLRLFDESLAGKVKRALGIGAAFSTSALSAPAFAAAVFSSKVMQSFELDGSQLHMAELRVADGSPLAGRRLGDIEAAHDVKFLIHRATGKQDLLPQADHVIAAGDTLIVLARLSEVDRLDALAAGAGAAARSK